MGQRVAILGASNDRERYAYRALRALRQHGHQVYLVTPNATEIDGLPCVASLDQLSEPIDTLTMYVGPAISTRLVEAIVRLRPGRVIFNPGSENPVVAQRLTESGITHEDACTLVLLGTNQF